MLISRIVLAAAVSMFALPAIAADGGSGSAGTNVTTIGGDAKGGDGQDATPPSGNGGSGGPGGSITQNVTAGDGANQGFIQSIGGNGGNGSGTGNGGRGGDGGDVTYVDSGGPVSQDALLFIDSYGGNGGKGGVAGAGGNGGDGGTVTVVLNGDYGTSGQLYISSAGGSAGRNGCNNCPPIYGEGGRGGDLDVEFNGRAHFLAIQSSGGGGGVFNGGGNIDFTLRGTLGGLLLYTDGIGPTQGDVRVTLENGAVVNSAMSVYSSESAELIFSFVLATQAEVDQVAAQIAALSPQVASSPNTIRTISVGVQTYTFDGFTSLTNALRVIAANNPGMPITVTYSEGSSVGDAFKPTTVGGQRTDLNGHPSLNSPFAKLFDIFTPKTPNATNDRAATPVITGKLRCDNRAVTVFSVSDGSFRINIRLDDGRAYAVGDIVNGKFKRAAGSKWVAGVNGYDLIISERTGSTVASCDLPN